MSQPTVSRALRDDPVVSRETRHRVHEAAAALGYVASRRGRNLSSRHTGQVAIVVSDLGNPFYIEALEHLHRELAGAGVRAVVHTDSAHEPLLAEVLLDGSVDGAVLTTTRLSSDLPGELAKRGLPVVLFNRIVDDAPVDVCASENFAGAQVVATALAELGHTRIGALLGPPDTSTGRDREAGFRAGLSLAGRALPDQLVRRGEFTFAAGQEGVRGFNALRSPPTAVFCANDVIALGALDAARELELAVPAQLTVVGFDDIAMAAWRAFALTTVRQDLAAMAATACELLMTRIGNPELAARVATVHTDLVRRQSHGPPAR